MSIRLIFVFFCNSILSSGNAQTDDSIKVKLRLLAENIRGSGYLPYSIVQELRLESKPRVLLPLIEEYRLYPNPDVQKKIYEVYFDYAVQSNFTPFRREMVNKLLCACTDSIHASYACGYVESLLSNNSNLSQKIKKKDYDALAKRKLLAILNSRRFGFLYSQVIGFLEYKEAIPRLNQLLELSKKEGYQQRVVTFALARMGQKQAIRQVTDSLSRITNIQDIIKEINVLKYIKRQEILPFISMILFSSKTILSAESEMSEQEDQYEPISNYALDILSSVVEDFPVQYSDARYYVAENLKLARNWFKLNKSKIKFKTDEY